MKRRLDFHFWVESWNEIVLSLAALALSFIFFGWKGAAVTFLVLWAANAAASRVVRRSR